MSSQYENLTHLDTFVDFFKIAPMQVPEQRLHRGRRVGGFIRAAALPAVQVGSGVDAELLAEGATADSSAAVQKKQQPPVVREWVPAQWGLVPHWVKSASDARLRAIKLLEARNETVSTAQAFRDAWLAGQRCIVPMQAFFEDDLRTGKPVPTRISRVDGMPMGVAGVWSSWKDPVNGEETLSYAILTINANSHALMQRYQHAGSEKRMPAILGEGTYDAWLTARQEKAREFLRAYPSNWLTANPVESKQDKKNKW